MTISALVLGTLLTQPTQRTSQRGANFTTCRIRVASAGSGDTDSVVANAICFDQDVQRELLSLGTGEQVAASGTLKVGIWTPADGQPRPSVDLVVGKVLSAYSVSKKRKAAQPDQDDRQQDRPSDAAWRAAAPAGRGPRDQRRQHPAQRGAPADDDLDDGCVLPF